MQQYLFDIIVGDEWMIRARFYFSLVVAQRDSSVYRDIRGDHESSNLIPVQKVTYHLASNKPLLNNLRKKRCIRVSRWLCASAILHRRYC